MTKRVVAIYSVLVVAIVLLAAFVPSCGGGVAMPTFVAHFMTPEGEPYPFDVTISNGTWRKEFNNVTAIETEVPCNATYTLDYQRGGLECYRKLGLSLSLGETREFEFYALDPSQMELRTRPYIWFQEVGANASLSWEYNPDLNKLTWTLSGVSGKFAGSLVEVDNDTSSNPSIGVQYYPPGSEPEPQYWEHDGRAGSSCKEWLSLGHHGLNRMLYSSVTSSIIFSEIDPSLGTIRLGYGLYNEDIRLYPINTTLRSLNETILQKGLGYPQYAVPPGSYILSTDNVPEGYASVDYPINTKAGKGTNIDNFYLPKITDLKPFDFLVAAESAFSHSSSFNLTNDTGMNTLSVAVSTETDYDWWGCFVLPGTATVAALRSYDGAAWHNLTELYHYTINTAASYDIVCVRITPETERLALNYTTAPPA